MTDNSWYDEKKEQEEVRARMYLAIKKSLPMLLLLVLMAGCQMAHQEQATSELAIPIKKLTASESVTTVKLADYHVSSPFAEVVHVVRLPDGQFLALSAKDPKGGCTDPWNPQMQRFMNPCHGSVYNILGEVVAGPAVQGLDHFAIRVSAKEKTIYVDVKDAPTPGAPKHP